MPDANFTYDVLIVGTGNAASSAALAALEKTPRVGMLEKATQRDRGGNSMLTVLMRFAFNGAEDLKPLIRNYSDDEMRPLLEGLPHRTEAELWDEIMRVTNNQADQDMLQVHVTESLKTVHWLASKGHDWSPATIRDDNVVTMNGGGAGLQKRNFAMLEKAGVKFHYETAALELVQDSKGKVTGVKALTPQGIATFNAKSVVLACGSFESNPEMRARYLGPGWDLAKVRGSRFNTGDGVRMALEASAMPYGNWSGCHVLPTDVNTPNYGDITLGDAFQKNSYLFGIMVNSAGQRFFDEGSDFRMYTYVKCGLAVMQQPQQLAWQVFDSKNLKLLRDEYRMRQATRLRSDTLEGLADQMEGINRAQFLATVREFNAAVQTQVPFDPNARDGRCTKGLAFNKSNWATTIDTPPFEAFTITAGITFTFGGLKVNTDAQVMDIDNVPIPGLYAAGEMVGGLFYTNYPGGSGLMSGARSEEHTSELQSH